MHANAALSLTQNRQSPAEHQPIFVRKCFISDTKRTAGSQQS